MRTPTRDGVGLLRCVELCLHGADPQGCWRLDQDGSAPGEVDRAVGQPAGEE